MRLTIPGSPRKPAIRPAIVGPGRLRKVGIIGGSPMGLRYCPWNDPTWEFWTHSSSVLMIPYLRADRIFDVHPPHCYQEERKNGFKDYYGFLKSCPTPIYMQRQVPEIPQSRHYPYEMLKMLWPGTPFGSQCAYMIALALYEGVTHLGFWGISYAHESEYAKQRANAERWVGIAQGQGVHIILPPDTPFCREPYEDYAYESHATPEKYAVIKEEFRRLKRERTAQINPFNKAHLKPLDGPEAFKEAARLRALHQPEWVKQVAKFAADEEEPDWLKEMTTRERALEQGEIVLPADEEGVTCRHRKRRKPTQTKPRTRSVTRNIRRSSTGSGRSRRNTRTATRAGS